MKRVILIMSILLMIFPNAAVAEGAPQIKLDDDDLDDVVGKQMDMLVISGWLGEDNVFTTSMRLTAEGGDVEQFIFLSSDLEPLTKEGNQADEIIGRERVALTGEPMLSAGVPKDFQVNVTDVRTPGTYEGSFDLLIPGQQRDDALTVPLRLEAKARPQITPEPGTSPVQINLVNCGWKVGCLLARPILNAGLFVDEFDLTFDKPVHADSVKVGDPTVTVRGENTGYPLTTQLEFEDTATFDAEGMNSITLTIDRSRIPPDHYTGTIALTMEGAIERLRLPVDLNVRTGPTWVILCLIVGLLLGQAQRFVAETGKGTADTAGTRTTSELIVGVDTAKNDTRAWLQLLLKIALFIGLVVVGIETFYVNQGLFFGANPLTDYLSLVLWGLTAEVTSRTLSTLRG
jgi:hypothetical protein